MPFLICFSRDKVMIIFNILFIRFPDRFSISETFEMESFTKTYIFLIYVISFVYFLLIIICIFYFYNEFQVCCACF